jgi:hypothetical protein
VTSQHADALIVSVDAPVVDDRTIKGEIVSEKKPPPEVAEMRKYLGWMK